MNHMQETDICQGHQRNPNIHGIFYIVQCLFLDYIYYSLKLDFQYPRIFLSLKDRILFFIAKHFLASGTLIGNYPSTLPPFELHRLSSLVSKAKVGFPIVFIIRPRVVYMVDYIDYSHYNTCMFRVCS